MPARLLIISLPALLCMSRAPAQSFWDRTGRSMATQFAGSVGMLSVGGMLHAPNEKWGAGISVGHTPAAQGGPLTACTLRLAYVPWHIAFGKRWVFEPIGTGLFVSYTRGLDLVGKWPEHINNGYYWWSDNFRQHLYLRAELDRRIGIGRMGAYFEANTNDLYLYSWWPNRRSISPYDIIFFGTGIRWYFPSRYMR